MLQTPGSEFNPKFTAEEKAEIITIKARERIAKFDAYEAMQKKLQKNREKNPFKWESYRVGLDEKSTEALHLDSSQLQMYDQQPLMTTNSRGQIQHISFNNTEKLPNSILELPHKIKNAHQLKYYMDEESRKASKASFASKKSKVSQSVNLSMKRSSMDSVATG